MSTDYPAQAGRLGWRFWVSTAAAVFGAAATVSLGNWQLSRAQYKDDQQARIHAQRAQPAIRQLIDVSEAHLHRQIVLNGKWHPQATIYLDNRPMDGRAGFFVLTPLVLEKGGAVLVQRGWAPRNASDRAALPPVATPDGLVTVLGRLALPPSQYLDFTGPAQGGAIRQNLDLAAYRGETGLALPGVVIVQTGDASEGLLRNWPEASSGSAKNRGYAAQWFALAALITALYVWFQIVKRFFQSPRID